MIDDDHTPDEGDVMPAAWWRVAVGGYECLDREVVDGPGVAAAGLVDESCGVVGEQGVGPAGEGQVVA